MSLKQTIFAFGASTAVVSAEPTYFSPTFQQVASMPGTNDPPINHGVSTEGKELVKRASHWLHSENDAHLPELNKEKRTLTVDEQGDSQYISANADGVFKADIDPVNTLLKKTSHGNGPDDQRQWEKNHRISESEYDKRFSNKPMKTEKNEGFLKYCEFQMCFMNDWVVEKWIIELKKKNPSAKPLQDNSIKDLCNYGYCKKMSDCMLVDGSNSGDWGKLYGSNGLDGCGNEADKLGEEFESLQAYVAGNKPKPIRPKKPLSEAALAMKDKVMGDVFEPVQWDDIKGLEDTKAELRNSFELQYQAPQLFHQNKNLRKLKSILLYGPPGTGKTMMAKAVRTHAQANAVNNDEEIAFLSVTSSAILDKWVGSSGQNVAGLFELARYYQPSVIFFDEFDALAPARESTGNDGGAMMQVITELLAQMQGANQDPDEQVLIIGATNRPAALDSAIMSRMEKHVYVPLPDKRVRREIIEGYLEKENQPHGLTKKFMSTLCGEWTEHFSARELNQLYGAVSNQRAKDLAFAQAFIKIDPHPLYKDDTAFPNEKALTVTAGSDKPSEFAIFPIVVYDKVRGSIKKKVSKDDITKQALLATSGKAQLTDKQRSYFEEYNNKKGGKDTIIHKNFQEFNEKLSTSTKPGQKQKYMGAITLQRVQERHFIAVRTEIVPQVTPAQLAELEEYNAQKNSGGQNHAEPALTAESRKHLEMVMQLYMQSGSEGVRVYLLKLQKLADNGSMLCSKTTYAAVLFHSKKALAPELDDMEDYELGFDDEDDVSAASDNDDDDNNDGPSFKNTNLFQTNFNNAAVAHEFHSMGQQLRTIRKETGMDKAQIDDAIFTVQNMMRGDGNGKKNLNNVAKKVVKEDLNEDLVKEIEALKDEVEQELDTESSNSPKKRTFISRIFGNRCNCFGLCA